MQRRKVTQKRERPPRKRRPGLLALAVLALTLPFGAARASVQEGVVSWYGEQFQGRRTASGERFDMNAFTAAHKTLPFGTRVRVRHATSGREVVVRINDRGPFTKGRVIDLSRAAAASIGLIQTGVGPVVVLRD